MKLKTLLMVIIVLVVLALIGIGIETVATVAKDTNRGLLVTRTFINDMPYFHGLDTKSTKDDDVQHNLQFVISIYNDEDFDLDRAHISVYLPQLDLYRRVYTKDLDENERVTKKIMIPLDIDVEPGFYDAVITVSNDKIRKKLLRIVEIEGY